MKTRDQLDATPAGGAKTSEPTHYLRVKNLPAPELRELPEPPKKIWKLIGPGIVGSGVGLASGEFILWPYITSQVGFVFLWGAALGITIQWFLNMEIERYTLATGETAISGFNRFWKHWGLFFVIMAYFQNLWPGWVSSSATMFGYLFGTDTTITAIIMLVVVGTILTLAPVVYVMLEKLLMVKVAVIGLFFIVAVILAIRASTWEALPTTVTSFGTFPTQLGFATLMGAIAFAGAGGAQNLAQSSWIRDKGFGMGRYVPRIVSPITGKKLAAPDVRTAYVFEPNAENLSRWKRWWRFASLEQALAFAGVTFVTILLTSMLAHSTLSGRGDVTNSINFLFIEGTVLAETVGPWFGTLFWAVGAFSLFAAAVGIVDYTSRLGADIIKTTYLRQNKITESRIYFIAVWSLVLAGVGILALGLNQPIVLLIISACVAGVSMFFYSILLVVMNRRSLPKAIRINGYRMGVLIFAAGFFGVLAALTIYNQLSALG